MISNCSSLNSLLERSHTPRTRPPTRHTRNTHTHTTHNHNALDVCACKDVISSVKEMIVSTESMAESLRRSRSLQMMRTLTTMMKMKHVKVMRAVHLYTALPPYCSNMSLHSMSMPTSSSRPDDADMMSSYVLVNSEMLYLRLSTRWSVN